MYRLAEQLPVAQGPAAAGEEVPLLGYTSIHVYIYIYTYSLSLSLSMYIYIYRERERRRAGSRRTSGTSSAPCRRMPINIISGTSVTTTYHTP